MNIKRKVIHYLYSIDFKTIFLIILLSTLIVTFIKIKKFKTEFINESSLNNNDSKPLVFIGGSPRSGTLFNFWLDSKVTFF